MVGGGGGGKRGRGGRNNCMYKVCVYIRNSILCRHRDPSLLPTAVCESSCSQWHASRSHYFYTFHYPTPCTCVSLLCEWTMISIVLHFAQIEVVIFARLCTSLSHSLLHILRFKFQIKETFFGGQGGRALAKIDFGILLVVQLLRA